MSIPDFLYQYPEQ